MLEAAGAAAGAEARARDVDVVDADVALELHGGDGGEHRAEGVKGRGEDELVRVGVEEPLRAPAVRLQAVLEAYHLAVMIIGIGRSG